MSGNSRNKIETPAIFILKVRSGEASFFSVRSVWIIETERFKDSSSRNTAGPSLMRNTRPKIRPCPWSSKGGIGRSERRLLESQTPQLISVFPTKVS